MPRIEDIERNIMKEKRGDVKRKRFRKTRREKE